MYSVSIFYTFYLYMYIFFYTFLGDTHPVRLVPVRCRFPHGHPITPHVRLAVEFPIIHTLWSIPLQGPFPSILSLEKKGLD